MRLLSSIAALILIFSSFAIASSQSPRARGAALFTVRGCQHCHTINNIGGHKGPNLSGVGRKVSKAAMRHQIVYGGMMMPAFGNVLQPHEIKDLIAYLHSCREKPAQTAQLADSK